MNPLPARARAPRQRHHRGPLPAVFLLLAAGGAPASGQETEVAPGNTPASPPAIALYVEALQRVGAGDLEGAEAAARRWLGRLEQEVAPGHPSLGNARVELASILARRGQHAAAAELAAEAVPNLEEALGPENPFALRARWAAARYARDASRPEDAVELVTPLRATLNDYVTSGRAKRARWEEVKGWDQFLDLGLPRPDEAGVIEVTAFLGFALAEAGDSERAEPVLVAVKTALDEVYGPGHPELLRVQETLDQLAGGDARAGVRKVGRLGRSRAITFEGNATFTTADLQKELAKDLDFVLASHPAEPLDVFLEVLAERLCDGYRYGGFPEAAVEAVHRDGDAGGITVTVAEEPRFFQGDIRVEGGGGEVDAPALRAALLRDPGLSTDASLAARVRRATDSHADQLPPPDGPDVTGVLKRLNQELPSVQVGAPGALSGPESALARQLDALQRELAETAAWEPGRPARFISGGAPPPAVVRCARDHLAGRGRPLARLTADYDLGTGGSADLVLRVEDPGPKAVVGRIKVSGSERNTAEEVRRLTGLETGVELLPDHLDEAVLALWRCGRFFPFAIDRNPRGDGSPQVDIHIRVRELEGAAPLSVPPTPEQAAVLRFFDWVNRGMDHGDILIKMPKTGSSQAAFGWSQDSGLLFELRLEPGDAWLGLSLRARSLRLGLGAGSGGFPALLDLPHRTVARIHLLPTNQEREMNLTYVAGVESRNTGAGGESGDGLTMDLLLSPAYVFLKPEEIRREGGSVFIDLFQEFRSAMEIELASGQLLAVGGGSVDTRAGCVRERQAELEARLGTAGSGPATSEAWRAALPTLAIFLGMEVKPVDEQQVERALAWADLVIEAEAFAPLRDALKRRWGMRADAKQARDRFEIPPGEGSGKAGMLSLLIGLGFVGLAEEHLPPDSWAQDFARELAFILGGRTEHSAAAMEALLADPSIGPIGCALAHHFLHRIHPSTARRFLQKARGQATAPGFRKDWQLLLDSPSESTGSSELTRQVIDALARLSPEDEAKAAALLPAAAAPWFHRFLENLRGRPVDGALARSVAPLMDELWEEHIGEWFLASVEETLNPPADPALVAATVDGHPVPRFFVRLLEEQHRGPHRSIPLPEPDPTRPWTARPALACAVRAILAETHLAEKGVVPPADRIFAGLDRTFPDLAGEADDGAWVEATGVTRRQLMVWVSLLMTTERFLAEFDPGAGGDAGGGISQEEVERYYQANAATLGRRISFDMVRVAPAGPAPSAITRAYRLSAALAGTLSRGLPLEVLGAVARIDLGARCDVSSRDGFELRDLHPALRDGVEGLAVGAATAPVEVGNSITALHLRGAEDGPAPPLAKVERTVRANLRRERTAAAVRAWYEQREAGIDIAVLAPPAAGGEETGETPTPGAAPGQPPPRPGAPAATAFEEHLAAHPASGVGRLGAFWSALLAGEEAGFAARALDRFLEAVPGQPRIAVDLVLPLAAHGRADLARRCLEAAHQANPRTARARVDDLLGRLESGHPQRETLARLRHQVLGGPGPE